jgi:hypothetical protein
LRSPALKVVEYTTLFPGRPDRTRLVSVTPRGPEVAEEETPFMPRDEVRIR